MREKREETEMKKGRGKRDKKETGDRNKMRELI